MGYFFIILLSIFPSDAVADPLQEMDERVVVVEEQAKASCGVNNVSTGAVRLKLSENLNSESGAAHRLQNEIQNNAEKVNFALDHADEIVWSRFKPVWEKKVESTRQNLDEQLKTLREKSRSLSFEKSEKLRDEIKQTYRQYASIRDSGPQVLLEHDPQLQSSIRSSVKELREKKVKELNFLVKLGDRVHAAINKAAVCQCRVSLTGCRSKEEVNEEKDRYAALSGFKKAKADYETAPSYGANSSSTGSAR